MPEKFTCPRRIEDGTDSDDSPLVGSGENLDEYSSGHGLVTQSRGCSYCGSMPPDEFMELVRNGAKLGATTKSYKFYVNKPVRAKFYTQHLSEDQGWEFMRLMRSNSINWDSGIVPTRMFIPGPSNTPPEEWENHV